MSRVACFLSVTTNRQHSEARSAAFLPWKFTTKNHHHINIIRSDSDAATSILFHSYKRIKRKSSSYWSLQTQQDDSSPRKRRRRRRRATRTDLNTNNDDDNVDSKITSSLFKHISISSSNIGKTNERRQITVPTIYLLTLIGAIAELVLPPITSTLLAIFFGVYLALLLPIIDEYDNNIMISSLDENEKQYYDDVNERNIVAPSIVAFLGAVASAALLSPQALVVVSSSSDHEKGLLLSSELVPYYLFSGLVILLGGYVLWQGVNETINDTRQWEEEEMEALSEKRERSVMNRWDDELLEKDEDGLNLSGRREHE
jgi:hypothetical protein